MRSCGRIRHEIHEGWNRVTAGQLANLELAVLSLGAGQEFTLDTGEREHAAVLIRGECRVALDSGLAAVLGPRSDPFEWLPFALFVSR